MKLSKGLRNILSLMATGFQLESHNRARGGWRWEGKIGEPMHGNIPIYKLCQTKPPLIRPKKPVEWQPWYITRWELTEAGQEVAQEAK